MLQLISDHLQREEKTQSFFLIACNFVWTFNKFERIKIVQIVDGSKIHPEQNKCVYADSLEFSCQLQENCHRGDKMHNVHKITIQVITSI